MLCVNYTLKVYLDNLHLYVTLKIIKEVFLCRRFQVSNPHFKWGFNLVPPGHFSGSALWAGFALPLVLVTAVIGGSLHLPVFQLYHFPLVP